MSISIFVVQAFHIGLANELGSRALNSPIERVAIESSAGILFALAAAVAVHIESAVIVDGVVQQLQAVSIVPWEFQEPFSLGLLINDGIDEAESFEVEFSACLLLFLLLLVLLVEVTEERWTLVAAKRFRPGRGCQIGDTEIVVS